MDKPIDQVSRICLSGSEYCFGSSGGPDNATNSQGFFFHICGEAKLAT
jgi:hypothetical protein